MQVNMGNTDESMTGSIDGRNCRTMLGISFGEWEGAQSRQESSVGVNRMFILVYTTGSGSGSR